jgi:hypothetical protein
MSGSEWVMIITCVSTGVVLILNKFSEMRSKQNLERRLNLLWESELRAGETRAVNAGMATKESPVRAMPDVVSAFRSAGMVAELEAFFASDGIGLDEGAYREKIESRFGRRMFQDIAKPNQWEHDACMRVAMAISKGTAP